MCWEALLVTAVHGGYGGHWQSGSGRGDVWEEDIGPTVWAPDHASPHRTDERRDTISPGLARLDIML